VICAEIFLWLTDQNLITLKMFGATFRIGGAQFPPLPPPLATRLRSWLLKTKILTSTC